MIEDLQSCNIDIHGTLFQSGFVCDLPAGSCRFCGFKSNDGTPLQIRQSMILSHWGLKKKEVPCDLEDRLHRGGCPVRKHEDEHGTFPQLRDCLLFLSVLARVRTDTGSPLDVNNTICTQQCCCVVMLIGSQFSLAKRQQQQHQHICKSFDQINRTVTSTVTSPLLVLLIQIKRTLHLA